MSCAIFFRGLDELTLRSHRICCNDLWSDHFATVPAYVLNRKSSMTSLFRPLLSSLLCSVIAFGQLPALLHLASCHGHASCLQVTVKQGTSSSCSHGCRHGTNDLVPSATGHVVQNEESPAVPLHDSEQCAICHSLANPVGLVLNFELALLHEGLCELPSLGADCLPIEASMAIPQPRGPPLLA